jgi:hypothetical protein
MMAAFKIRSKGAWFTIETTRSTYTLEGADTPSENGSTMVSKRYMEYDEKEAKALESLCVV